MMKNVLNGEKIGCDYVSMRIVRRDFSVIEWFARRGR